jgi:hypothetical protein
MKTKEPSIIRVVPAMAVPGGEITIECRGFRPGLPDKAKVMFGETEAIIASASEGKVIVRVPEGGNALGVSLSVEGRMSALFPLQLATRLAGDLHPVTNPVISPDGDIITTISGARGEQSSKPLIRVRRSGEIFAFPCEIMNPTGLAFGPDRQLYISSRSDGTVVRYTDYERLDVVADDLGVPCGIVFDAEGSLYVGDRTGKIYRIDSEGTREDFAVLPPSVSAYHLAADARGGLYATAPTVALRDPLYRIGRGGEVSIVISGLARPQGLAVGPNQEIWVAAAYHGRKGIFRISPETGTIVHQIAAPMLVGLAFDAAGLVLADGTSIYRIRTGGAG